MDQQQIDIIHLQPFQTVLDGRQNCVDRRIVPFRAVQHFGGDEQVGTGNTGGTHACTNLPLIAIHTCRIDMAISCFDGRDDSLGGLLAFRTKCAKADGRDVQTIGMNQRGVMRVRHKSPLLRAERRG